MAAATPANNKATLGISAWTPDAPANAYLSLLINAYFDQQGKPIGHASFGFVETDGDYQWSFESSLFAALIIDGNSAVLKGQGSLFSFVDGTLKTANFEFFLDGLTVNLSITTGQGPLSKPFYSIHRALLSPGAVSITH